MVTPQPVDTKLTQSALFLVMTLNDAPTVRTQVLDLLGDISSLVRGVGFRIPDGKLSCITGIGSNAWDLLFGAPRPKELHPFQEINGVHHAPSTPGDLLFHIRATRMDLCFEMATALTSRLEGAATVVDEVHGFKYFDARDLLGFVDGTENPTGQAAFAATVIGDEDPSFTGGSYVIVQKYLHNLKKWNAIPTEVQEHIIGRKKVSDIELPEAAKPSYAHNVLTNIEENGQQLQIVRDNMPFGEVGKGEFGTYFIGYARSPARTEQMLQNMFIGKPPGNYDRILDVSTAVTGSLFFIPTSDFLDDAPNMSTENIQASPEPASASQNTKPLHGSLGIGSLNNKDA
ncbi:MULTISPECIES: Dyp-type peroxidase [Acetobacter]|uniref:Peroxidase n=2 Tax=Acetobacter TaxID=434 RepID=A0AAN1PJY9_9PROT|nr:MULTISPECIES: Dyp-type peroxidase [Acetobacter]ASL41746.1 peroxidase [Acetobacter oryzifermentans]AXN01632.1 peroxidase [Acetobacter pomorum]KAA8393774.1 Dyp-type peroxidase [Acetobacter sp. DmW_125124]KAA8396178.1 Dyp-type peroxidase [Acetobacter sp. DmW_125128]KAA8398942.1 Dyp-type peroxidase [Acetobacter sp. DmW_125127]